MLSIIIPVLNEQDSLAPLYREITETCAAQHIEKEIIFVDDGSTDQSWEEIGRLAEADECVQAIRFRRNFGKAAALTAGMRAAGGSLLMTMDADLQDDPAEIPRFLEKLQEGWDVVNGWKQKRLDPWHKVYPSRVFNWMVSRLTGLKLHDHNCGFKILRAEVAAELRLYGEMHRFIPVLSHARGFRVTEIPVHHRPRQHGKSKYGMRRFLRGFLDLLTVKFLTGFGQRPQHMLGALGLFFFATGLLGMAYLAALWVLMRLPPLLGTGEWIAVEPIGQRPLLVYSVASLLLGAQAMSLGLLAELLVAYTGRESDTYSIAERITRETQAESRESAPS